MQSPGRRKKPHLKNKQVNPMYLYTYAPMTFAHKNCADKSMEQH